MTNTPPIPTTPPPSAGLAPDPAAPQEGGAKRRWHLQFVQDVLPFLSSLTIHAVLVILAVVAARVLVETIRTPIVREQIVPVDGEFRPDVTGIADGQLGIRNGLVDKAF